jgi:haloalkane dehalogenase
MSTRSLTTIFVFLFLISMKLTAYSEPISGQSPSQLSPPLEISNACIQDFTEHRVQHGEDQLYVREYAGTEPPVVLMHGFPDNLHLYDRIVPYLCGRHLILFDFLGWGQSDKPKRYSYTFDDQEAQLDAVIKQLGLQQPLLVVHDASGPAGINWALDHSHETGGLVILNAFFHLTPSLSAPEAIAIFADLLEFRTARQVEPTQPWSFARLSQAIADDSRMFRWLYFWQVGSFFRDKAVREEFLPVLYEQFDENPSTIPAFVKLNKNLGDSIKANSQRVPELVAFDGPVRIIFGASDPYLNAELAQDFHSILPTSDLFLLPTARHYVQMDEPERVAHLILSTRTR